MTVGETLARARRDAGLSIAEISIMTHIRQSIIDSIEHDDYSACGGDVYARGNIRAIAGALGVDSGPLVEAYDAARWPAWWIAATRRSEPIIAAHAREARGPGEEPGPATAGDDTQPITRAQLPEPVTRTGEPPDPVMIGEPSHPVTIGDQSRPIMPAEVSEPDWMSPEDRRRAMWIALGATLLAVAGLGGLLLALGTTGQPARHASVAGRKLTGGGGATHPAGTRQPSLGRSASSPGRTPSPSPSWPAGSRPAQALVPAGIAAFGPGGTGQGDSPQLARQALAGKPAQPWHSDWYTTPRFGNLQSGTGLLLDMGRTVTITSARIALGNGSGADLALRIGNSPDLASMPPAARANGAGGLVRLTTAPTRGRYVLLWFTRLPPDQAGTFQVSVYDIKLRGYP